MGMLRSWLFLLAFLTLAHAAWADEPALVQVVARVVKFEPRGLHDFYEDGSFAFFDVTDLIVEEPASLKGKTLSLVHPASPPPDDLLRTVGQWVEVEVDRASIGESGLLYDGSVHRVRAYRPYGPGWFDSASGP